jgi:hypothetical protein
VQDWDQVREVHAYPPSTGTLAIYKKSEFYDVMDYAIIAYRGIEQEALGTFFRNSSVRVCADLYK